MSQCIHESFGHACEGRCVPCETSGGSTNFTGTRRCNDCWEVERRLAGYLSRGGAKAASFIEGVVRMEAGR